MTVRIMIGNDQPLLLDALASTLRLVDEFDVVGVVVKGEEVLSTALRTNPTVAVLGAAGSGSHGLTLATQVRGRRPSCRVLMMAPSPTRSLVDSAKRAGVTSVVPMDTTLSHLVRAIRSVAIGCAAAYVDVRVPAQREHRAGGSLSEREQDVLRLTWAGASVREIAEELCLAKGSVRNVASAAIRKLEARNRFDAARVARERGLL